MDPGKLADLAAYYVVYFNVRGPDDLAALIKAKHPDIPEEEVGDMRHIIEHTDFPARVRGQYDRFTDMAVAADGVRSFGLKHAVGDVSEAIIAKVGQAVSRVAAGSGDVDDVLRQLFRAAQAIRSVSEAAALNSIRRDTLVGGAMQGVLGVKQAQLEVVGRASESQNRLRDMRRFEAVSQTMKGLSDESQAAEVKLAALQKMDEGLGLEQALVRAAMERYGVVVTFPVDERRDT